jgi:hypothetical protein
MVFHFLLFAVAAGQPQTYGKQTYGHYDHWSHLTIVQQPQDQQVPGLVVVGGRSLAPLASVETWPALPCGSLVPALPSPRARHKLALLPGPQLLLCGGNALPSKLGLGECGHGNCLADCLAWKPGQADWKRFATMQMPRADHAMAVVEGRAVVMGGLGVAARWSGEVVPGGSMFRLAHAGEDACAIVTGAEVVLTGGQDRGDSPPTMQANVDRWPDGSAVLTMLL